MAEAAARPEPDEVRASPPRIHSRLLLLDERHLEAISQRLARVNALQGRPLSWNAFVVAMIGRGLEQLDGLLAEHDRTARLVWTPEEARQAASLTPRPRE